MSDDGKDGRYPKVKGGVPMEQWVTERIFDSADYLDREPPRYADDAKPEGAGAAARKAAADKLKGKGS